MKKIIIRAALAAAIASSAPVFAESNPTTPDQPNIIILLADDIGYADPGFRGSGIETPALDSLAEEGMTLDHFYTTPICSPTRAALMTGRDPIRLGVAYSVLLPWDSGGVHTDEHFMPESFQKAGYQTAMFGKWHLGHSQQVFHPNERGFDHFYGHLHTEVGYYPPFNNLGGSDFQVNGQTLAGTVTGEKGSSEGYETFMLADQSSEWIRNRDKSRPFFLYLPFLAPHEPLEAPDELVEKYRDMKDERPPARSPSDKISRLAKITGAESRRPLYAAVVDAMDQAVARVLNTLDEEGIADNTIVMFFSDNGATRVYGRGGGDNTPFRGGKGEVYEGGIRVASVIRWPEKIPAGLNLDQAMTVMDVFPTLAKAAGVAPQNQLEFDGIDMTPALLDNKEVSRDDTIFFASEIPSITLLALPPLLVTGSWFSGWPLIQWPLP